MTDTCDVLDEEYLGPATRNSAVDGLHYPLFWAALSAALRRWLRRSQIIDLYITYCRLPRQNSPGNAEMIFESK
jgi:hypothetical protein